MPFSIQLGIVAMACFIPLAKLCKPQKTHNPLLLGFFKTVRSYATRPCALAKKWEASAWRSSFLARETWIIILTNTLAYFVYFQKTFPWS